MTEPKCLALYSYNSDFAHSTVKDGKPSSAVLLKLVKEGDSFKGYFSYNGKVGRASERR